MQVVCLLLKLLIMQVPILSDHPTVHISQLKKFLLTPYPEGLSCIYYEDYFGTTKSIVMDIEEKTLELCWGGQEENGWNHYELSQSLTPQQKEIQLTMGRGNPEIYKEQSL